MRSAVSSDRHSAKLCLNVDLYLPLALGMTLSRRGVVEQLIGFDLEEPCERGLLFVGQRLQPAFSARQSGLIDARL